MKTNLQSGFRYLVTDEKCSELYKHQRMLQHQPPHSSFLNKLRRCKIRTLNQKHKNVLFFLPSFLTCFYPLKITNTTPASLCQHPKCMLFRVCFLLAGKHFKWQLNILYPWKEWRLRRQLHVGVHFQAKARRSDVRNRSELSIHFTHKSQ